MNIMRKFPGCSFFVAIALLAQFAAAQTPPPADSKPQVPQTTAVQQTRITIEVSGGEKDVPIENASVYVKFIEQHTIKKDKKLEINVKTNRDGTAHVPDTPLGRALIQVVAEGWKTYGRWYDINDPKQVIKIHLERPPKWY
jgi:hypothetical protein